MERVSWLTSEHDSGVGLRRLWRLVGAPAYATEVSRPLGSHSVLPPFRDLALRMS
jgi:hypothetical protein